MSEPAPTGSSRKLSPSIVPNSGPGNPDPVIPLQSRLSATTGTAAAVASGGTLLLTSMYASIGPFSASPAAARARTWRAVVRFAFAGTLTALVLRALAAAGGRASIIAAECVLCV